MVESSLTFSVVLKKIRCTKSAKFEIPDSSLHTTYLVGFTDKSQNLKQNSNACVVYEKV